MCNLELYRDRYGRLKFSGYRLRFPEFLWWRWTVLMGTARFRGHLSFISFTNANLRPPSGQNLESNCGDSTPTQGLDDDVTQKVLKNISQFHLRNQKKKNNWFSNKPFLTMAINSFLSINFSYGRRKIPPPSYSKFFPKFKSNHGFATSEGCKAQIPLEWVAHRHCSHLRQKIYKSQSATKKLRMVIFLST